MMSSLSTMVTCHWSARRIQRYLDADPAAPLQPAEVQRLEAHLATCQKCATGAEEYRGVRRALARWSQRRMPDQAAAARLRSGAERLLAEDAE
jgi:anti-sigma factor RsiW